MILIVDFGSQTTHLISRRIKERGALSEIVYPHEVLRKIERKDIKGIILSGGPSSVYLKNAPAVNPSIFSLDVPILGICYGWQLMARVLGGVVKKTTREYGPELLQIKNSVGILGKLPEKEFIVYVSHGDSVIKLPEGFKKTASTKHVEFTAVQNIEKHLYGVQFHPEVEHTEYGEKILKNFLDIAKVVIKKREINLKNIEDEIREKVKNAYVIGAVSGGVDSTVASVLLALAIGNKFIPIYVDNGLMRPGTVTHIRKAFRHIGIKPYIVKAEEETLKKLKGVTDPEKKRKIIGNLYIRLFETEMKKLIKKGKKVEFLLQGTIYSDVIESKGTKHSSKIKSHHNVGGLPRDMKLKLLEPLRSFYKDEVRAIGTKLGLPEDFVWKQVFPGPGFAIRIRGEVTKERLKREKMADRIILEELSKTVDMKKIYMSFPIMTGALSTSVKGDGRFFGEVVAIRIIESKDVMTSNWSRIPYDILQKISSRIVNEVPGISRVVYDITTKPPATMEWE